MKTLSETIKASWAQSDLCWEMAADTTTSGDAAEWAAQGEECGTFYRHALAALDAGESDDVICGYLEAARRLEADGGDDQHARRALAALAQIPGEE